MKNMNPKEHIYYRFLSNYSLGQRVRHRDVQADHERKRRQQLANLMKTHFNKKPIPHPDAIDVEGTDSWNKRKAQELENRYLKVKPELEQIYKDTKIKIKEFDPYGETKNFDKTKILMKKMWENRFFQLIEKEKKFSKIPTKNLIKSLIKSNEMIWEGWKACSNNEEGAGIQYGISELLGTRIFKYDYFDSEKNAKRSIDFNINDFLIPYVNERNYFNKEETWKLFKYMLQATWETTQFILDKAGIQELGLYRAVTFGESFDTEKELKNATKTKNNKIKLKRNGAASFTLTLNVANNWDDGAFYKRKIIRAIVPRTAVLSIPAFGKVYKREKEVVVVGAAWKAWDIWNVKAPPIEEIPIETYKPKTLKEEKEDEIELDLSELDTYNSSKKHWLSFDKKSIVEEEVERILYRNLSNYSLGQYIRSGDREAELERERRHRILQTMQQKFIEKQPPVNPETTDVPGDEWNKRKAQELEERYVKIKPILEQNWKEAKEELLNKIKAQSNISLTPEMEKDAFISWLKTKIQDIIYKKENEWKKTPEALYETKKVVEKLPSWFNEANYLGITRNKVVITFSKENPELNRVDILDDSLDEEKKKKFAAFILQKFEKEIQAALNYGISAPHDQFEKQAKEELEKEWNSLSPKEKFDIAKKHEIITPDKITTIPIEDVEQENFDPIGDMEVKEPSPNTVSFTKQIAHDLFFKRAKQLLTENKIVFDEGIMKAVDRDMWRRWKSSSTSNDGMAIQLATAEVLGGRMRDYFPEETGIKNKDDIKRFVESYYGPDSIDPIGGWEGYKLLVQAKWETTQFLLDKAGIDQLGLYRAIKWTLGWTPANSFSEGTKDVETKIVRNGAASFTAKIGVANSWGEDSTRKVIRAVVPRTAVLSVPSYGQNYHSEKEVIVAGTAWKQWDVYNITAPPIEEQAIMEQQFVVYRGGNYNFVDIGLADMLNPNHAHWLAIGKGGKLKHKSLNEAVPDDEIKSKDYYHGTTTIEAAKGIIKQGIKGREIQGRDHMAPIKGKVYVTPHLKYAQIYAIGGDMAGSDEAHKHMKQEYGYVFKVKGHKLKDVQPDEDSVGETVYKKKEDWLSYRANKELHPHIKKKVMQGEYSYWSKAGKQLLKTMKDDEKLHLIKKGAHVAAEGPIEPDELYRIHRDKIHLLKRDASNFHDHAEKVDMKKIREI